MCGCKGIFAIATDTFQFEKQRTIRCLGEDAAMRSASLEWIAAASRHNYSHHFTWLGLPIIQFPQDVIALQEIIWRTRPDMIIETGIARGGSLVFYASMLQLLGNNGLICGIDVDIRPHNRKAIEQHPLARRIVMIEGSSIDPAVVQQAAELAAARERVMVVLDSNHAHDHVLRELALYSPLVSKDCYLVVLDTIIEDLPQGYFHDRPWDVGDNPKTAVREFLRTNNRFEIDREIEDKLLITVAPEGYLRCIADVSQ